MINLNKLNDLELKVIKLQENIKYKIDLYDKLIININLFNNAMKLLKSSRIEGKEIIKKLEDLKEKLG